MIIDEDTRKVGQGMLLAGGAMGAYQVCSYILIHVHYLVGQGHT